MSTNAWSDFFNEVLPHVPGCTEPVALNAIRNSAIRFCKESWAYADMHDPVSVTATVADVDFMPPDDLLVTKVLDVWYDGTKLPVKVPGDLDSLVCLDWMTKTGTPRYATQLNERQLRLVPIPTVGLPVGLTMRVAWKPTRASAGIDNRIYEEFVEVIGAGAVAALMMSPKKPYTNPSGAAPWEEKFTYGVDCAKAQVLKGYGRAHGRVKAHFV